MDVVRYKYMDEYAKAELIAHLASLSPQQRIEFIKSLGDVRAMLDASTKALTEIVTTDESVAVRAWAARTFGFDKFKEDKEPLVRAAWRESEDTGIIPAFLEDDEAIEEFSKLSSIERCGWIRSRTFPRALLELTFDAKSEKISLTDAERQWLIAAFLSGNRYPVGPAREWSYYDPDNGLGDKLWKHAAEWVPLYKRVRPLVFEHVEASDETRVELLAALRDRGSRHAIVRSASTSSMCLRVALDDDDDEIRAHAWARYSFPKEEWRAALEGFDLVALRGLCRNNALTATERRNTVVERLLVLGDEHGAHRESILLQDRAAEESKRRTRGRSVEARLQTIAENVNRIRFTVNILLLVVAGCVALAIVRALL